MQLVINNMQCNTFIGIHSWEKIIRRKLLISLTIDTINIIDYDNIINYVKNCIETRHFSYIEDLAKELLKNIILQWGDVNKYSLKVNKPPITDFEIGATVYVTS